MGSLNVQVKVLTQKAPLLFAWENVVKEEIECILVTCPCQGLSLISEKNDIPPSVNVGNKLWAANLAQALQMSEVVSIATLGSCESIVNGIELSKDMIFSKADLEVFKRREKMKKKRFRVVKKNQVSQPTMKDSNTGLTETRLDNKDDAEVADVGESGTKHILNSKEPYKPATISDGTSKSPSNESNSQLEKLGSVDKSSRDLATLESIPNESDSDSQTEIRDETHDNNSGQDAPQIESLVDEGGSGSREDVEKFNVQVPSNDGDDTVLVDRTIHMDISSSEGQGDVLISLEAPQNCTPHISSKGESGTYQQDTNQSNPNGNTVFASDTNSSLVEDQSLIKAINSIMEMYPGAVITEVPSGVNLETQTRLTSVDFIRPLSEEERKQMFKFRSDNAKDNLKKLDEGGKAFLCEHCGLVLSSNTRKRHLERHGNHKKERSFLCTVCGKAFYNKEGLRNHVRIHSGNLQFQCRYCPKKYRSCFGRTIHERAHFNVCPLECKRCDTKFRDLKALRGHNRVYHAAAAGSPDMKKPAIGRRGPRRGRSKPPPLCPGDPGSATCDLCNKTLRVASMPAHVDSHKDKMFTCLVCKKVMRLSTRYSHMKYHDGKKDHKCADCGKEFVMRQAMEMHRRIHTGERPIKCRYCDRSFGRYTSREVHETTHTGDRPFPCDICNKSWKDRPSYMTHMKKKHPGMPFYYKRKSAYVNQTISNNSSVQISAAE